MKLRLTFRKRLFLSLYATVILATVLLVSVIYLWLRTQTLRDVERAQFESLRNIDTMFSSHLDGFVRNAREVYSDNNSTVLLLQPGKNWVQFALPYSRRVNSIMANNTTIRLVALFDGEDILMMSQRENAISDRSVERMHAGAISQGQDFFLLRADHMVTGNLEPVLCIVAGQKDILRDRWIDGVVVGVDPRRLADSLFGDSQSSFYIVDYQGNVMLSSEPSQFGRPLDRTLDAPDLRGGQKAYLEGDIHVCAVSGTKGQYYVASFTPTATSLQSLKTGRNQLFLVLGAILLLSLPISLLLSTTVSRPVRELVRGITHLTPQPGEGSVDDIAIARAALGRTIAMVNSLKGLHWKNQQVRALLGLYTDQPLPTLFPGIVQGEGYGLVVFELPEQRGAVPVDGAMLVETISSVLAEGLDWPDCTVLPMQENAVAVLIPGRGRESEEVLAHLRESLSSLLDATITAAFSDRDEPGSLPQRYRICRERMRARILRGEDVLISRVSEEAYADLPIPGELAHALEEDLKQNGGQRLDELVDVLLAEAKARPYESAIRQICRICAHAARSASPLPPGSGENAHDGVPIDLYNSVNSCNTPGELRLLLLEHLRAGARQLSQAKDLSRDDQFHCALRYIREHFSSPQLSLRQVAEHLGLSSSHFSRVFHENARVSFPVYVNTLRMDRARQLLLDRRDLPVSEVARLVGFNTGSYFTAAFKKQYGVSPSKLRQFSLQQEHLDSGAPSPAPLVGISGQISD